LGRKGNTFATFGQKNVSITSDPREVTGILFDGEEQVSASEFT